MALSLRKRTIDAVVVLDRPGPYHPGQVIRPIVRLAGHSPRRPPRSLRLQLLAREEWGQRALGSIGPLGEDAFPARTAERILAERSVDLGDASITSGWQVSFQLELAIPSDPGLLATFPAEAYDGWLASGVFLRLVAEPPNALEPRCPVVTVPLVVPPPEASTPVERLLEGADADVRLALPRSHWLEGESVTGVITLKPHRWARIAIELELIRRERAAGRDGFDFEIVAGEWASERALVIHRGEECAMIFELAVPQDHHPTHRSEHLSVDWLLRYREARGLSGGSLDLPLVVCATPDGPPRPGRVLGRDLAHSHIPGRRYTRGIVRRMAAAGDIPGLIEVMTCGRPGLAYELAAQRLLLWRDVAAWGAVLNSSATHLYGRAARLLAKHNSHAAQAILVEAACSRGRTGEADERRRVAQRALATLRS